MARRLAAILATGAVSYSREMELDEAGTPAAPEAHREVLIDPAIAGHHGRIVKRMGDGALVEFASVVDAVACAVAIQAGMAKRNDAVPGDRRIELRIGIHLNDGVTACLEGLADPGSICVSGTAHDMVDR